MITHKLPQVKIEIVNALKRVPRPSLYRALDTDTNYISNFLLTYFNFSDKIVYINILYI